MGFNLLFKNAILFSSFVVETLYFNGAIKNAEIEQTDLLLKNIKRNQDTLFGIDNDSLRPIARPRHVCHRENRHSWHAKSCDRSDRQICYLEIRK